MSYSVLKTTTVNVTRNTGFKLSRRQAVKVASAIVGFVGMQRSFLDLKKEKLLVARLTDVVTTGQIDHVWVSTYVDSLRLDPMDELCAANAVEEAFAIASQVSNWYSYLSLGVKAAWAPFGLVDSGLNALIFVPWAVTE